MQFDERTVFVLRDFNGPTFSYLRAKNAPLLGVPCLAQRLFKGIMQVCH